MLVPGGITSVVVALGGKVRNAAGAAVRRLRIGTYQTAVLRANGTVLYIMRSCSGISGANVAYQTAGMEGVLTRCFRLPT
eukprot:1603486-Rhodomonas_salina.6